MSLALSSFKTSDYPRAALQASAQALQDSMHVLQHSLSLLAHMAAHCVHIFSQSVQTSAANGEPCSTDAAQAKQRWWQALHCLEQASFSPLQQSAQFLQTAAQARHFSTQAGETFGFSSAARVHEPMPMATAATLKADASPRRRFIRKAFIE